MSDVTSTGNQSQRYSLKEAALKIACMSPEEADSVLILLTSDTRSRMVELVEEVKSKGFNHKALVDSVFSEKAKPASGSTSNDSNPNVSGLGKIDFLNQITRPGQIPSDNEINAAWNEQKASLHKQIHDFHPLWQGILLAAEDEPSRKAILKSQKLRFDSNALVISGKPVYQAPKALQNSVIKALSKRLEEEKSFG